MFFVSIESPEKSPKISASTATKPSSKPQLPKEAQEASKEFANFLNKRLERKSVSDVSKQINDIVEKILKYPLTSSEQIDDLSALVQEFYQLFQRRLETSKMRKIGAKIIVILEKRLCETYLASNRKVTSM